MDNHWPTAAFGTWYPILYAHRTIESARQEALFALQSAELAPDALVLDMCCGSGRHSFHLIQAGHRVVGLDFSPHLLTLAQENLGNSASLVQGDMRAMPFPPLFDAVFNFFTSLGYFQEDSENQRAIASLSNALRPGGRFFIDHIYPPYLKNHLFPSSERIQGAITILESRWIDEIKQRVNKQVQIKKNDIVIHQYVESVQLYSPELFIELLAAQGLTVDKLFGDYSGAGISEATSRMILTGHKA